MMWVKVWRRRRRFKKFKIVVKKRRFQILGEFNPWVLLASGEVLDLDSNTTKYKSLKNKKVLDKVTIDGQPGVIIGKGGATDAKNIPKSNFVKRMEANPEDAISAYTQLNQIQKQLGKKQVQEIFANIGSKGLDDILEMVNQLGVNQIKALLKKMNPKKLGYVIKNNGVDAVKQTLHNFDEIKGVPGAKKLMDDFLSGGETAKGAIGEIKYAAQLHKNGVQIKQLGDIVNGKKAADIVLMNGKVIDVKHINWDSVFYIRNGKPRTQNIKLKLEEFKTQVARRRTEYGQNVPVRYAFRGSLDDIPQVIQKGLQDIGVEVISF